ncbi:MAG TPA: V-type ATP synthase subunit I, partial [Synergistaceae bacterium]|nr:V-type ATP synthase subunit I [Synergistaceae bacterium]
MAVDRMKKAEIYVHRSALDGVLAALQKTGSFEVRSLASNDSEQAVPRHPDLTRLETLLGESRFLLRFLEPHFATDKSAIVR